MVAPFWRKNVFFFENFDSLEPYLGKYPNYQNIQKMATLNTPHEEIVQDLNLIIFLQIAESFSNMCTKRKTYTQKMFGDKNHTISHSSKIVGFALYAMYVPRYPTLITMFPW